LFEAGDPNAPDNPSNGWLSADPVSGTVPPGTSITVSVYFDAAGMESGESTNTTIQITSNDALAPTNEIPVSMDVIYGLAATPAALDFGGVKIGSMATNIITLQNRSANAIAVELSVDSTAFELDSTNETVNPAGDVQIPVVFNAQDFGARQATVVCIPDGKQDQAIQIAVKAFGYVYSTNDLQKTITFEPAVPLEQERVLEEPWVEQGYSVAIPNFMYHSSASIQPGRADNGTHELITISAGGTPLSISRTNGAVFDAVSIDLAEYSTVINDHRAIQFVGNRQGGSQVSHTFQLDGVIDGVGGSDDFETFRFPNTFTNLLSLEITTPPFSLDNLVVLETPASPAAGYSAWQTQYLPAASPRAGLNDDFDGDGLNNQSEYIAGTNPADKESRFKVNFVQTADKNGFVLTWNSVTGRVYSVYWKRGLSEGFQPLETGIRYPQNSYTDSVHQAESCGFYKVGVELQSTSSNP
ncbi:MAG TPA: hypothetical protein VJ904_14150, partial [Tichowtungia sp.]|nr:hypothetical protein [Tichowtungia sp.]